MKMHRLRPFWLWAQWAAVYAMVLLVYWHIGFEQSAEEKLGWTPAKVPTAEYVSTWVRRAMIVLFASCTRALLANYRDIVTCNGFDRTKKRRTTKPTTTTKIRIVRDEDDVSGFFSSRWKRSCAKKLFAVIDFWTIIVTETVSCRTTLAHESLSQPIVPVFCSSNLSVR